MKKLFLLGLAALLAAPMAIGAPTGQVAGYLAQVDTGFADGIGPGVRGWVKIADPWFVHGELEAVTVEQGALEADLLQLRVGGGLTGKLNPTTMWMAKGEYVDSGGDFDEAGFGVHGGAMLNATPQLNFYGTLGFLLLDDSDGLEVNIGGSFAFAKQWAGVLDYRTFMGETDLGFDFDLDEIRAGVAFMF